MYPTLTLTLTLTARWLAEHGTEPMTREATPLHAPPEVDVKLQAMSIDQPLPISLHLSRDARVNLGLSPILQETIAQWREEEVAYHIARLS